jgi:hypothetical protein
MSGSKKFVFRLSVKPFPSRRYFPSKTKVSEHPTDLSVSSKHSHRGRVIFVPLVCPKMHLPRPAQFTGQNISGQTLLSLRDIIETKESCNDGEMLHSDNDTVGTDNAQTDTHLGQVTVVPNVPLKVLTSIC